MQLLHKEVWFDRENPLYHAKASESVLNQDFEIKSGEWHYGDGYICGKNPGEFPGMIVSRNDYFGNVMVDFFAKTVPPSTHDINVMWNGSWDDATNTRSLAYVAGVEGWWRGMVGIEKSPDYKLNVGNPLFEFTPGREYHIQAGSVDGHCFVVIDDTLIVEVTDPAPIDGTKYGKIGFEAYASMIAIREISVYRLLWEEKRLHYPKEF